MQKLFKTKDAKELIIKALEYALKEEKAEYTCIYKPFKEIRRINKNGRKSIGVYAFLKKIKTL